MVRFARAEGFTLVELLVVIAIVGILAGIAIPQIAAYRRRGYDTDIRANIKNASITQEAYFTDKETYSAIMADLATWGFKQNSTVKIGLAASVTDFVVTGTASAGCSANTGVWSFSSSSGVLTGNVCN